MLRLVSAVNRKKPGTSHWTEDDNSRISRTKHHGTAGKYDSTDKGEMPWSGR